MPTPKQDYALVSSEKHIKEYTSSKAVDLHSACDDVSLEPSISLIQPLTWWQIFASKYNKLWYDEGEGLHATQVLFFKVLREGLTTRLPALYPSVRETIANGFADYLEKRPAVNGSVVPRTPIHCLQFNPCSQTGWKTVEHFPMFEHITVNIVGPIFFGQELCKPNQMNTFRATKADTVLLYRGGSGVPECCT